jgi:predicted dehydrogenase/acetyltransferase-like isoleucine patch superfamily enzyme
MAGNRNDPPRVAVVGCGHWGRNLVRNFHALSALSALCDADSDQCREMSMKFEVPALSFDQILASELDAVVLATPAATHARLALQALQAGKHVFIEKPLALDVDDAERVQTASRASGRIVMVGHLLQYHPAFLSLKSLVAEGKCGRLQYVYSTRLNLGRIRREEDVFWSFAPHDISMIIALAGEVPDEVEAIAHCYLHRNISDVTTTHLRFASGVNAHIFVSWLHPSKEQRLVVVGDAGMAVFDDGQSWSEKLVFYPHRVAWHNGVPTPNVAPAQPVAVPQDEPLRLECLHFLDCIREHREPRTGPRDGIDVLRVLDAAKRSMSSGRPSRLTRGEASPSYFAHETACIDNDCEIGAGTRIWHFSHILPGAKIGRNCVIGQNVMVGPDVVIGDNCKIQNNVSLYTGVVLEDGVFCGPSCVFTNVNNPRAEIERKNEFRPTHVGAGTTIGANATIVCGHRLGAYCFVAAGAVVVRDVAPHALVAGNPAHRIGWMSHSGERLGENLVCPRTGTRYAIDSEGRLRDVASLLQIA